MADNTEALLRALLSVVSRQAIPPSRIAKLVRPGGAKQLKAFNMCDGTRGQGEIAKALSLDQGNFSRTVARWVDAGIVFRLGEGRDSKLLYAYPLSEDRSKRDEATE